MRTKLWYMPLEPYKSRYTYQLARWAMEAFERRGLEYELIDGQRLEAPLTIQTGQVLDAHQRCYYSCTQMAALVQKIYAGEVKKYDRIYFEDMFTPGIESLPYIFAQCGLRPYVFVHCMAQSIDPDDFIHSTGMMPWMGYYEKMVDKFVDGILATSEEMVANMRIAGWRAPVYNMSGLAFGKKEVQSWVDRIKPFNDRPPRVSFAARWDAEKQPHFFMDLIEAWEGPQVEFCVLSGVPLRSNDSSCLKRAKELVARGQLKVYEDLSKQEYYDLLNDTRVLFNCALQDWVSNTVSEADALGANVLFPAYRSFPETFANDHERLYVPWSLEDAISKLARLLVGPHPRLGAISDYTNSTMDRIIDILELKDTAPYRHFGFGNDYRKHVSETKYLA